MNIIKDGWFTEISPDQVQVFHNDVAGGDKQDKQVAISEENSWAGQAFSLEVKKVLVKTTSPYQDILVFKSKTYGNVLVLDGIIQCTERDEFSYQEMISHVPLCAHPNPQKVLIIGGGDGGVLREVLKHTCVQSVVMCEIDQVVVDVSKQYLPGMSCALSDPRALVHIGDGIDYVRSHPNQFDVIITDSSDPIGPAEALFETSFYAQLKTSLRPGGILCSQAESVWLHPGLIKRMMKFCGHLFPTVAYGYFSVPTYTSGVIGCILCAKDQQKLVEPARTLTESEVKSMNLRYYNSAVHKACFVLPNFMQQALESAY